MHSILVVKDGFRFKVGLQQFCMDSEDGVHVEAPTLRAFPILGFGFGGDAVVVG